MTSTIRQFKESVQFSIQFMRALRFLNKTSEVEGDLTEAFEIQIERTQNFFPQERMRVRAWEREREWKREWEKERGREGKRERRRGRERERERARWCEREYQDYVYYQRKEIKKRFSIKKSKMATWWPLTKKNLWKYSETQKETGNDFQTRFVFHNNFY